ncbi:MAG: Txe/YoeB family addiction module toxin [Bacteroidetes bacterium]|nr:MAG: Txe/YoeB family addiction module toxin [Bacteroidota bacterium]
MRSLVFEGDSWTAYEDIRKSDRKLHNQLRSVLKKMLRSDPASGIGKPEKMRHGLSGYWSRRITRKDRIVYKFDNDYIYIFAIGGHYDQF